MSNEGPQVVRPLPRRPFSLGTPDTDSRPGTPPGTDHNSATLAAAQEDDSAPLQSRTRSILNLTSSTLFGIYSPSGYSNEEPSTPWGTGAQTPVDGGSRSRASPVSATSLGLGINGAINQRSQRRRNSVLEDSTQKTKGRSTNRGKKGKRRGFKQYWLPLLVKNMALAIVGVCYGVLISHLHDRDEVAPVKVEGIPHHSYRYSIFWGVAAMLLGQLIPAFDRIWNASSDEEQGEFVGNGKVGHQRSSSFADRKEVQRGLWAPVWNDVVRSIGAFAGITFAIRKLPWQSTLQLSLTLALSNPAIWYLLDRTAPGFIGSAIVALSGTAASLLVYPDLIPSPAQSVTQRTANAANATLFNMQLPKEGALVAGLVSQESVGVATWIASVLFVSCVCFGNIGRRL